MFRLLEDFVTRLFATTILFFLLSGCAVSQKYEVSMLDAKETDLSVDRDRTINLPSLGISVRPFNARLVSTWNTLVLVIPLPVTTGYPDAERFLKKMT